MEEEAIQIARLILEGKSNNEIAKALFKSPRTIEGRIHKLMRQNDCRNRSQLAATILNVAV
jgi:DNA-binding NarL/FixJ family response regulator